MTSFILDDWKYLQEGLASIVFTYTGNDLKFTGKVLRLFKIDIEEEKQYRQQVFYEKICQKIFGSYCLEMPFIQSDVNTCIEFIKRAELLRPAHRVELQQFPVKTNLIYVLDDLTASPICTKLPISAIELKIKCTVPSFSSLPGIFTINQFVKKENNLSLYEPFELFSGHEKSLIEQISILLDNPQNNLRLFEGQTLQEKIENHYKPTIKQLLVSFLNKNEERFIQRVRAAHLLSAGLEFIAHKLLNTYKESSGKSEDEIATEIESLGDSSEFILNSFNEAMVAVSELHGQPSSRPLRRFKWTEDRIKQAQELINQLSSGVDLEHTNYSTLDWLRCFMAGRSFTDMSVMLTIVPLLKNENGPETLRASGFVLIEENVKWLNEGITDVWIRAKMVDLDIKAISHFDTWRNKALKGVKEMFKCLESGELSIHFEKHIRKSIGHHNQIKYNDISTECHTFLS